MQALLNAVLFFPLVFGAQNVEPQSIPEPPPHEYRIPECSDIESENEYNKPGFNENGDIVMCNPLIFGAYPNTAPWSYFNDDFTTLFEDGSYRAQIWTKGKYCPADTDYHCTIDVGDCAYPAMGCTP